MSGELQPARAPVFATLPALFVDDETGTPTAELLPSFPEKRDRLLIVIGPDPSGAALIRRGRGVADYLRADCLAVYVSKSPQLGDLSTGDRENLERHLNFACGLQIETRVLDGQDVAETVGNFARLNGVTRIFIAREKPTALRSWFAAAMVQRLVSLARDMQVTVVADRSTPARDRPVLSS